ncbi:hypothetical protein DM02DRAFT_101440 [Periconia macrospinosa]|uniref:Uncharacterized protein n=1 Tax=Periconia macrospinosa TaxID=97972 RepID=A0A2V1DFU6_9PLEO|nr:hypothetical protein DM02DRAFT_101440 [Periconia macrospinosa]
MMFDPIDLNHTTTPLATQPILLIFVSQGTNFGLGLGASSVRTNFNTAMPHT